MEKVKAIIIEDEFAIAEDIRRQLEDHGIEVMATFERAETVIPFFHKYKPDILLVDIQLLGPMDGVQLVKQLLTHGQFPFVYVTANSDQRTYDLAKQTHPYAFLVKPFNPQNLLAAIDLAIFNFASNIQPKGIDRAHGAPKFEQLLVNQSLFVRTNGRYEKVIPENMLFVEADGSYVHIQTSDHRYTLSQNLSSFLRKTPLSDFVRVHRSFVVNINRVDSFDESSVIVGAHKLPLGDNFKADFLSRIHYL